MVGCSSYAASVGPWTGLYCGLGHRARRTVAILLVLDFGLDWTVDHIIGWE